MSKLAALSRLFQRQCLTQTFYWTVANTRLATIEQSSADPLLNRAISGLYAPGSTFKMVVGLAALEAGVISQKTRFSCPGHMELGNAKFHCWRKDGHGAVNLVSALEQSCDVFFYEIALKTGIKKIKDMARRLGLGDSTGLIYPVKKVELFPLRNGNSHITARYGPLGKPWSRGLAKAICWPHHCNLR